MNRDDSIAPAPGSVAVILPAAGSGRRFGDRRNKLFADLNGKPLWYRSAERLRQRWEVGRIVMPVSSEDREEFEGPSAGLVGELKIEIVAGGAERTDSVGRGLEALLGDDAVKLVAVHDAARPLVPAEDLGNVFRRAAECDAAILATPVSGTVKRDAGGADPGSASETIDRRELWVALTPQVFGIDLLRQAHARHRGRPATDDAQLVERIGHRVALVCGSAENIKITHPEDLLIATAILARQANHV